MLGHWRRRRHIWKMRVVTNLLAEIVHTTYAAPSLRAVQKPGKRESLFLSGVSDRTIGQTDLKLWQDAKQKDDPSKAMEFRLDAQGAHARVAGGSWQAAEGIDASLEPDQGTSSFLQSAKNVRLVGKSELEPNKTGAAATHEVYDHFVFQVDEQRMRQYMQEAVEARVDAAGGLPAGLDMAKIGRQIITADARGEAWIDAEGKPRRIAVRIEYPQQADGTRRSWLRFKPTFSPSKKVQERKQVPALIPACLTWRPSLWALGAIPPQH